MLEGITVVRDVVIVVVRIGKERVACGKHVTRGEVWCWQQGFAWFFDGEQALVVVGQVLTEFIAQVGIGVPVTYDLYGLSTADAAVIGGDDDLIVFLCDIPEKVGNDGVAEPGEGDAAVGTLVVGQFANHL